MTDYGPPEAFDSFGPRTYRRPPSRARLAEDSGLSVIAEYFELRSLGNNHRAACARLDIEPNRMVDRVRMARNRGEDVPHPPEGKHLADDWN